ncbi:MAG: TolB family protein [Candidatus Deferrimicrobiaceae bacterium]
MRRESVGKWAWYPAAVLIAAIGLAGCGGGGGGGGAPGPPVGAITRAGGVQGDGDSDLGYALSQTGQFVAFSSGASNQVVGDTNLVPDVFLFNRQTGATTRVSVGLGVPSLQATGASMFPSISADGRYVAFESLAENLVGPGQDTNLKSDIFVRDRTLDVTERASVALGGFPTQPDGDSNKPSISADGRYVAFFSFATNLLAGDTNGVADVFLYDRQLAVPTQRVSVGPGGVQGNGASVVFGQAVSDDGTRVAFESAATNLVAVDANGAKDVFVWTSGTTALVSVNSAGTGPGNGESRVSAISGNGRYVVFESDATDLVASDNNGVTDIFVRDLTAGTTTRVSVSSTGVQANGASFAFGSTTVSDNGALIVFESDATNLVAGDTNGVGDVFVRDTVSGTTDRLSITSASGQPTTVSTEGAVSRDGTTAAFSSFGLEFVTDNPSGFTNVYILAVP